MPAPVGARDASPVAPIGSSVVFGTLDGGSRATSIVPSTTSIVVDPTSGIAGTVQFRLEGAVDGTPVWSVTNTALGTVDSSGLFVASGKLGGETDVTARIGGRVVVAHVTVVIRYRQNGATAATLPNAGGGATGGGGGVGGDGAGGPLPDATVTALDGTPVLDPTLSLLYPYNQTVFPSASCLRSFSGIRARTVRSTLSASTSRSRAFSRTTATSVDPPSSRARLRSSDILSRTTSGLRPSRRLPAVRSTSP